MSTAPEDAEAAAAAAAAAARSFNIELWTLYAVGICATALRTYARVRAVGIKSFQADDYLVWVGAIIYSIQSALAYNVGHLAHGLANNGMTDAERAALSPNDPEYEMRVLGSKIQVAGWTTYSALLWSLKMAMLVFYIRLTQGLGRRFKIRITVGFALVIGTFLASILTVFIACRPFNKYWQINPDPGNVCQAAISRPIIWVSFASNVLTDIYLILIPLPMLWQSTLKPLKKIASTIVLGAGIFVLVCATLKSVFVLVDPINGAQLAGSWGTKEAFVAVITTNLPMIFPLLRSWFNPIFGSTTRSTPKNYPLHSPFQTIGGTGGDSRSRRGPRSTNPITANMTFSESEERMVEEGNMYSMKVFSETPRSDTRPPKGIVVMNEVQVVREDRSPDRSHSTKPPSY
ncbi:hypothetical protein SAPIO_CDS5268 [Scedosporium apiospermum]|uniref:Rhodopsin domain-containing protein n=1 Tax=Pseudallescheria apiosperma TaxID=563466 RepID=A0A084G680_PSEDA|nr:uncharacterized protein SAPIO_CDS5268 [Scedosporium apiospermum]KEZ42842.1 hypothetical protein SAPIO_CDS5268 [Scedosporium apiospermum]